MADGEGFPDRSVAAQARDSLYSRGHLRRRQVELAEGNVELPVFLLAPPPHYDNYDGVRVCGCRAEALCSLVIIILILLPSGPQRLQVFEENSCTSYPLSPPWYIHPGVLGGSFWECSEIYYWVIKWNLSRQKQVEREEHNTKPQTVKSPLIYFSLHPPTRWFLLIFTLWMATLLICIVLKQEGPACLNSRWEYWDLICSRWIDQSVIYFFCWLIICLICVWGVPPAA